MRTRWRLGWLVVLAVAAGAVAACGDDDERTALPATGVASAPASTAGEAASASTTTDPRTTAAQKMPVSTAAAGCSAAGLPPDVPADPALPAPVALMRADLARAAATCDWSALALLVDRNGPAVRASFGDDSDPIGYWQRLEAAPDADAEAPRPMRALRVLLALPGTAQGIDADHGQYVWPPAFASETPTEAELQQVADTGLYSSAMLEEWLATGLNYLGYRVLITSDGDWTAFVAGD